MASNFLKIGTKITCVWRRSYAALAKDLGNAVPKIPEPDRPRDPPLSPNPNHAETEIYIVSMGGKPESESLAIQKYKTMISNILGKNATDALLYSFTKMFSGFSVRMNEEQKNLMSKVYGNEIDSIMKSQNNPLRERRSRIFMRPPRTLRNYSSTEGVVYREPPLEQLFKESENLNKNFQPPDKVEEKPTPEQTRSPSSKASCMSSITVDKCFKCGKTAYPLEKVTVMSQAYHKMCFKCSHDGCALSPSNYVAFEGIRTLYCKYHYSQLLEKK